MDTRNQPPRILIVGGGYIGMYTARRLNRRLGRHEARVTLVDPQSYMTYQPFLPEAGAGSIQPRHVVVPLRRVLPDTDVVTGHVSAIDHARRRARVELLDGEGYDVPYDILVVAVGAVPRTLPVPGLAECGIGFQEIEEAISLRNHVIAQLDIAESTRDERLRRRALAFVFVGGGYAGVEAIAELEDMARAALRDYRNVRHEDMRWILVEATERILPEVGPDMARYALDELRGRGIDVKLSTRLDSALGGHVKLSDGTALDASTLVWTAGVRPAPMLADTDLPLDSKGRVKATASLRVEDVEDAWTAGDCAAVPDLTKDEPGALCGPSAQHAMRQARRLADNLVAVLRGQPVREYRHRYAGSVASLGLHKGVAQVYGLKVRGWPAWFLHRTYHLTRLPTFDRKIATVADWTLQLFFRREIVSLGSFEHPRAGFEAAARQQERLAERAADSSS
ncbi:MAG: NAD(P)/FAD-dependent oxidoreductase [Carbonactinosporaceae bacterium]